MKAIGIDLYNQCITGGGMAVVIRTERENDISESDRQPNGE